MTHYGASPFFGLGSAESILPIIVLSIYTLLAIFTLIALWRLIILLPVLTNLAASAVNHLDSLQANNRPPERRLLDIEDLLRQGKITLEEYTTKKQEVLKDL